MAGKRYYTCNYNYFDIIDSESKAYWLGFIAADGSLHHTVRDRKLKTCTTTQVRQYLKLVLARKDKDHLQKFLNSIDGTYPIKDHTTNTGYYNSRVLIEDNHFYESLLQYELHPNKSLDMVFPDNIPEHLIKHYIRGYFDGDGCISRTINKRENIYMYECSILGTREFLETMKEYLPIVDRDLDKRYKERVSNNWTLRFAGNIQVQRALSFLYDDATIYLDRKYQLYNELIEYNSRPCKKLHGKQVREPVNTGCTERC